jgi:hypothetical protein
MLSVVGHDINIYTATLSPQERAFLYLKIQRQLYLFIDEVKENVMYYLTFYTFTEIEANVVRLYDL